MVVSKRFYDVVALYVGYAAAKFIALTVVRHSQKWLNQDAPTAPLSKHEEREASALSWGDIDGPPFPHTYCSTCR
ncbi:uncharacterized protein SCHCODRAFT_02242963 [Schizophyllum commune H4-8]|uniref:uncharacterized protein n=1 Tax=Schizophyllum commune (strain H4-8 / FGSC 9210) TaxID=578458 RepID=UPI00215EAEA1|nr:uncharacterized protein SCHCODRAFT_02242963 [Schizophyllum commune H4-8]KAI5892976.1 hypothetical protein SCHCODRAFT_02242963 [Schizophyllum commune H4-8]